MNARWNNVVDILESEGARPYKYPDTVPFTPLSQGVKLTLSLFKDLTDNNLINIDQLNS